MRTGCAAGSSVPVLFLTHLEASALQVILAGRPVKILVACLSHSRLLFGADLCACFCGFLPFLLAGHLGAQYLDWKLRLSTRPGKIRDYANENSCLMFGPDNPTTNPYNSSATPDVLDIVITKDLPYPMYLT
jgi:hypothetical protein